MARAMFWNLHDFGNSDSFRNNAIGQTIYNAYKKFNLGYVLLCEIKSGASITWEEDITWHLGEKSTSFKSLNIFKQEGVKKKNSKLTNAQLGYFGFIPMTGDLNHQSEDIPDFKEVFGHTKQDFGLKGSNIFKAISKRNVVCYSGMMHKFFFYHANSSYHAKTLVPWVSFYLDNHLDQFMLFGDFNQNPEDLEAFEVLNNNNQIAASFKVKSSGDLNDVVFWKPNGATHNNGRTLDYIITKGYSINKIQIAEQVTYGSEEDPKFPSDHSPIVVIF